jgi:hypothetical protein
MMGHMKNTDAAATEKRVATTAREVARMMRRLRAAGEHAAAAQLFEAGKATVAEIRAGRL